MSDEIYEYLLYDQVEHHSPASFSKAVADRTITVGGFSKTFSMTGWRLGTLVAPPEIAKAVAVCKVKPVLMQLHLLNLVHLLLWKIGIIYGCS